MKQCEFCGKFLDKSNISRHIKSCIVKGNALGSAVEKTEKYACDPCGKSFSRVDNFKRHGKTCQLSTGACGTSKIQCVFPSCSVFCKSKGELIQHIHLKHQDECNVQSAVIREFQNEVDFLKWKDNEEHLTFSYFSQQCGEKSKTTYFYCQKDGSEKPHEPRKTSRKRDHVKMGTLCIASMHVKVHDSGVVNVCYYPTHSHALDCHDIKHQPLSKETYRFIDQQLSVKQSPVDIQRSLQTRAQVLETESGKIHKDCYVSSKLIAERARSKAISSLYHRDDAKSVMLLKEKLVNEDSDLVLVYKPSFQPCQIGPEGLSDYDDLFMFAIQTKEQRELMLEGSKNILVVDETHGTNQYDFQLLNMVVVDQNRHGWPVAHCITSKSDERCLTYFFEAVKSKCPNLDINCVITDDDAKLINSMDAGFDTNLRHLLCKWHIARAFKKQVQLKAPKHLHDEMFIALMAIIDTKNTSTFKTYLDAFRSKYATLGTSFVEYFEKYYLTENRTRKWASCYRNFPHLSVDTTGHVESFHKRLKSDYMKRKPNKRIDNLIQLLLTIAEDDKWKRKRIEICGSSQFDDVNAAIDTSHQKSISIPDSYVKSVFDNMWDIKSGSKSDISYQVTKWSDRCQNDHCFCRCKSYQCPGLCSHLYHCTCSNQNLLCKHIHKLHSFLKRGVHDENNNNTELPVFSEPVLPICLEPSQGNTQPGLKSRENRKKRLIENLKYLLQKAEADEWDSHILSKVDADVDTIVKNVEVITSKDINDVSGMPVTTSFTSTEKLKTQNSQLLPFKRQKKRKKLVDPTIQSLRKKVVIEDLLTHADKSTEADDDTIMHDNVQVNAIQDHIYHVSDMPGTSSSTATAEDDEC